MLSPDEEKRLEEIRQVHPASEGNLTDVAWLCALVERLQERVKAAESEWTNVHNRAIDAEAQHAQVSAALAGLWHHVETGTLARNISHDHSGDWILRAASLVMALKAAQDALAPTPPKQGTET